MANVELLAVRTSASFPRKPMRVILFRYISVLRFQFPNWLGSHMARPREWARLPSAEGLLFRREPEQLRSAFFAGFGAKLLWEEQKPAGARSEAEDRVPQ